MSFRAATTQTLLDDVRMLQAIQKSHPPVSPEWRFASRQLAPRFRELARRQKAGAL